jgi:hypothetical protein
MRAMVLVLLLPLGCTIEQRGAPGTDRDTEVVIGGQTESDTVALEISAPRVARVGDAVPITIAVYNNHERSIDLNLTGRDIVFDIVVTRADSTIVWQRLRNAVIQPILQLKTLAPGESFSLSDRWQASEAGQFVISARLPTDSKPLQPKPISITIR